MVHPFGIGHVFSEEFTGEDVVRSVVLLRLLPLSCWARWVGDGPFLDQQFTAPFVAV